jgi:isoleucyl-tRNA synthetase
VHSYPHAERDGKPVIFRTTEQWFLSIDANELRQQMLEQIDLVSWVPKSSKSRIQAMVEHRPDWCLSRQRPWGVGIPIFYGKQSGKPVMDPDAIEYVAQLVEREGSDAWYSKEPHEILPPGYTHPETGETEFIKETDVFDVWLDSACTNLCVLEGRVHPQWKESWPPDLVLEGSDQHRGWFNGSLVIATALKDQAPYKEVVTHGFVVDQQGLKMSKRAGNIIDPQEVCDHYGADMLRYWVASVNYENDVPCSDEILKQCGDYYRRVRNTLRFLLSNLYDYEGQTPEEIHELDQWFIEQVQLLMADCIKSYESYDFVNVINAVHNFCVQQISSFYADAIKDRVYCDGKEWPSRRSAQYACHYALLQLVKLIAPILPYTAEEVYERIPCIEKHATVHAEKLDVFEDGILSEIPGNLLQTRFAALLEARSEVFTVFEQWKLTSEIKDSQDVCVKITHREDMINILKSFRDELPNYLKMSWVTLEVGETNFEFRPSPFLKCDRSRIRRPDVEKVGNLTLSYRDRKVLNLV